MVPAGRMQDRIGPRVTATIGGLLIGLGMIIASQTTLFLCFVLQAICILLLWKGRAGTVLGSTVSLTVLSALIGAHYGAKLALFPAITKDFYGLKHFGANYGLVFTAWGWGGFGLSLLAGQVYDVTQSFGFAYVCSAVLLIAAAAVTFVVTPPKHPERN